MKSDPPRRSDAPAEGMATERSAGRLTIFFGYAPGVGKTEAMQREAQDRERRGRRVAVGCVRGGELDLEAILTERPDVVVLDDLAHGNIAGSRHPKRWQDVNDLLEAGIDVLATLDVQHVESLRDVVARITGTRARETVPDAILDRASAIQLVDLPPEKLLERRIRARVPPPDETAETDASLSRRNDLIALRELALRKTAELVSARTDAERSWITRERVLVCVGPSPFSARLVRATRRIAEGLKAPWIAATAEDPLRPLPAEAARRLDENLALAEALGAETARLPGSRVSETILAFARARNVTRIVVGKPSHSRLRDLVRGSLLEEVVRGSGDIDVHVINGEPDPSRARPAARAPAPWRVGLVPHLYATGVVLLVTAASALGSSVLGTEDIVMLYLLGIMLTATRLDRGPSFLAAVLSVAAFDVFFVPPTFTFAVHDSGFLLTFAMMFAVGLVISSLAVRLRQQESAAREREKRTRGLYQLGRELSDAADPQTIADIAARHIGEPLDAEVRVFFPSGEGGLAEVACHGDRAVGTDQLAIATLALERARPTGRSTDTLPDAKASAFPLLAGTAIRGVASVGRHDGEPLDPEQRSLIDSLGRQVAAELDRRALAADAAQAALRARTEELRSSLLSAVSHDLRTPLATITGAATTVRDDDGRLSEDERRDLLGSVCDEAGRLARLVTNLLDMTRLESGGAEVKREWVPLEEIVGSALTPLEDRLAGRPVRVRIAEDLPMVAVDPVLFAQVFVNLVENAVKYTPPLTPIEIEAEEVDGAVEIEVRDSGPGFEDGEEAKVFEKFTRGHHPAEGGVGLGLAICRGIVQAHGGTIVAENRVGGGALFRIRLPHTSAAPVVDAASPPVSRPGERA